MREDHRRERGGGRKREEGEEGKEEQEGGEGEEAEEGEEGEEGGEQRNEMEWRPYQDRGRFSKPIHTKEERMAHPVSTRPSYSQAQTKLC